MENIISSHNKNLLGDSINTAQQDKNPTCNCSNKLKPCPLEKHAMFEEVHYLQSRCHLKYSSMSRNSTNAEYIDLATNSFKERYYNHHISFRHAVYPSTYEI